MANTKQERARRCCLSFTSLQAAPGELVQALYIRGWLSGGSVIGICPD